MPSTTTSTPATSTEHRDSSLKGDGSLLHYERGQRPGKDSDVSNYNERMRLRTLDISEVLFAKTVRDGRATAEQSKSVYRSLCDRFTKRHVDDAYDSVRLLRKADKRFDHPVPTYEALLGYGYHPELARCVMLIVRPTCP